MKRLTRIDVSMIIVIALQVLLAPKSVLAENRPAPSLPSTVSYEGTGALDMAALLPAKEEPIEHRLSREQTYNKQVTEAKQHAKDKEYQLKEQRVKEWEEAFPVVSGSKRQAEFFNSIAKDSVDISRDADLYPSVLMAQAGLESGFGRSGLSKHHHNLFGIKGSFNGASATLKTWEDVNGSAITIHAGFRSYPSTKESILDYAQLLKSGLSYNASFYSGAWRSQTDSHTDVTAFLQGRYATDTQYTDKLNRLIDDFDLTRFDEVAELDTDVVVDVVMPKADTVPTNHYLVKEGDTIQLILYKTGLSIDEFVRQNDLPDGRIHVNQVVSVEKAESEPDLASFMMAPSVFKETNQLQTKTGGNH